MKKALVLLIFILLLAGCSTNGINTEKTKGEKSVEDKHVAEKNKNFYIDNPQATDDRPLQEIGRVYEDKDGQATLKALNQDKQTVTIGPMELTIQHVKAFLYLPSPDLIDFFHEYTENEEEFNYVKVFITVKNTSADTLNFNPIAVLETSAGEKKNWQEDFYLEGLNGDFKGKEDKLGNMGFVIDKTNVDEFKWIKLTTSQVLDQNQKIISKEKVIKINF